LPNLFCIVLYAIVDIETTGGLARSERITEIAIVLHDGQQVVDTFSSLINPERSIPVYITQLTGITDQMVADAPKFYEIARKIVEMTEGAIFVAHNVTFDYNFIKEEFARLGFTFTRKQLCTVRLSRKVFPGLRSYSLSNLKKEFGIVADKSHRALDDTLATVQLFERILEAQGAGDIKALVNHGVRETKLPPNITLERLHSIPEACGVYYLHDSKGEVIYVGKSLNIRKRLFEHFSDLSPKGEKMRTGVEDISYEITGSELIALLHESAEIKRLQPRINRALRKREFNAAIFSYTDQRGYHCLAIGKKTAKNAAQLQSIADYPKLDHAKGHLMGLVRQFELCHKLANLDFHDHACFHYGLKQCRGACVGEESPESYNERVAEAIKVLDKRLQGSFVLLEPGRTPDEQGYIIVEEGKYLGFGYADRTEAAPPYEDLLEDLQPCPITDPDAGRIIQSWIAKR